MAEAALKDRPATDGFDPTSYHVREGGRGTAVEIRDFSLWYGTKQALFDVGMSIEAGLVTALIGPSGCGKSTLLRCLNRMNDLIDGIRIEGRIAIEGQDIYAPAADVIAIRKRMGMVFQKPNPFPMSIFENVAYPLRVDGIRDKVLIQETVERRCAAPRFGRR